jgi:hypothetical protein
LPPTKTFTHDKETRSPLAVPCNSACCPKPRLVAGGGGATGENVTVTTSTQLAMGWSAKQTLLGKTLYNDARETIGKVDDLIISPERDVSCVNLGAGGFIGMGRHDVAIPLNRSRTRQASW